MTRVWLVLIALLGAIASPQAEGTFPGEGVPEVTLPTTAALVAATINANTQFLHVMSVAGGARCPTVYAKGTTSATGLFGEVQNVASGIWWEPQYQPSPIRACQFGTVPDGTLNGTTNAVTGTDNTAIIQAALNYAMVNKLAAVCLDDGLYKTTDTLHMGWGESFYTVNLTNCNGSNSFNFSAATAGPTLLPTAIDRCAVAIQGARDSGLKGVTLVGQNQSYVFFGGFPWNTTTPWPTTASGWIAPALRATGTTPGGIQRYAPYGGICADPYAGQPPSSLGANPNYPFVTNYPAFTQLSTTVASISSASPAVVTWGGGQPGWLSTNCLTLAFSGNCPIIFTAGSLPAGFSLNTLYYISNVINPAAGTFNISATPGGGSLNNAGAAATNLTASRQYGMAFSSNISLDDMDIEGFPVGVISGSPTTNSQNDFFKIRRAIISFCGYCVAINNDQSRNVAIRDISTGFAHTFLTNNQFGQRNGQLGGPLSNISGGNSYQLFQLSMATGAPVSIDNCYAEGIVRFGTFGGGSEVNNVFINGCNIQTFPSSAGGLVVPVSMIEVTGGTVGFTLNSASWVGANRIDQLFFGPAVVIMNGGTFNSGPGAGTGMITALNNIGLQLAFNYTGGYFVSGTTVTYPLNGQILRWLNPTAANSMTSTTSFGNQLIGPSPDFNSFTPRAPYTQSTRGYFDTLQGQWTEFIAAPMQGTVTFTPFSPVFSAAPNCDLLSFNYPSGNQARTNQSSNIAVGDILFWKADGTFLVATSIAALSGGNYPMTARQMNNMNVNAQGQCTTNNIALGGGTLTGDMTIIHVAGNSPLDQTPVGAQTPRNIGIAASPFFADVAAGSTTLNDVAISPNVDASNLTSYFSNGDVKWSLPFTLDPNYNSPWTVGSAMTTVTNGAPGNPGTVVVSGLPYMSGRFPLSPLPVAGRGVPVDQSPFRYSAAGNPLPTCNGNTNGTRLLVSDAAAPTYHGNYTSGGALQARVLCVSPNWVTE